MKGFENLTEAEIRARNARIVSRQKGRVVLNGSPDMTEQPLAPKRSKYRNQRCVVDGQKFDSKREGEIWLELRGRQQAGEITGLQRQIEFPLCSPGVAGVPPFPVYANWFADFVYVDCEGNQHVVDVKSDPTRTAVYKLKKAALASVGIMIEEVE